MGAPGTPDGPVVLSEIARVTLPTSLGVFDARAFDCGSGLVCLALTRGDVAARENVLVRVHSECLTGDALGSLRCDCGIQLQLALRAITAAGEGVLIYATGHEGRGIGLVDKLRSYVEQDRGADTVDANLAVGAPVDARHYGPSAAVLDALGVRSVRLLTNNPAKVEGLRAAGTRIAAVEPLATASHTRNRRYLQTKERRLGHTRPAGEALGAPLDDKPAVDVSKLMGTGCPPDRPYVVLKFAQTLDGRIATATGDARWISGEAERRVSHALRAACDGVLVGVGTVVRDDPQLTVRMVPGASPRRFVLDSTLRLPLGAKVLGPDAATTILTTDRARREHRRALAERQVGVEVMPAGPQGVDLRAALAALRRAGVETLLVEGGARVITSLLGAGLVDRLVVGVAPRIIGQGTDAVGPLGITSVADGLRLVNRSTHVVGEDLLIAGDVRPPP
ncbi:MAG TPA: GTP cyclohydrolase II RibA [Acidimicrobiales bacterium]|nr:GTP cyclohydrolase II RibA [Acidimicrobiales bacterium]